MLCYVMYRCHTAPPVEDPAALLHTRLMNDLPSWTVPHHLIEEDSMKSLKKKYAKESWPGKKPAHLFS